MNSSAFSAAKIVDKDLCIYLSHSGRWAERLLAQLEGMAYR